MTDVCVLVVASAKIRDKWDDLLQRAGYGVCGLATSSREAHQQILETEPDVILIDLNGTGDLDGVEAARQIRSCHRLPLLYLVGLADHDLVQRALASEPDGLVFDPSRSQELHAAIELARQNYRARHGTGGQAESPMPSHEGLSEAHHMIEELAAQAEQRAEELNAVFAAMGDGVVVYDAGARATRANAAAIAFYGWDLVGEKHAEAVRRLAIRSVDGRPVDVGDLPVPRALRGESVQGQHLLFRDAAGEEHIVRASVGPVRAGGQITGAVATFHDITEEVEVQQARDRLIAILEATPDMVFIASPGGDLLYMNQAARRARGLDDDAPLDGLAFGEVLSASAGALLDKEGMPAAIRDGIWRGQTAIVNAEGREIPVSQVLIAHRGPAGQVEYLSSIARDVTERQKMLAELVRHGDQLAASLHEKDLMLHEIHHRVKNNLQIISSLLDMEAAGLQDPIVVQALQDSRNRVKTMALIHECLYQSSDVGSVDAPGYVRSLTSYLFGVHRADVQRASGPIDLELKVQDVYLDINTAIPLGLILNELVSNALKYAFVGNEKTQRRVRVELGQEDNRLVLEVSDNGNGLPDEVNLRMPRTLGLRLVKVLSEQLRGTLRVQVDQKDGSTFRIAFPQPVKRAPGR